MSINIKGSIKKEQKKGDDARMIDSISKILSKDISFTKKKLTDRRKEAFYSEMTILLSSGIDIKTALEIVIDGQTKPFEKELFQSIYKKVIEGESLSEVLETSSYFTTYEIFSIRIGEESGKIAEVLKELSIYFQKKIKQGRQVSSALTYPILVLTTAILSVAFMLGFIVPMFMDVFKRFNGKLPALTEFIVNLSEAFKSNALLFLFFIIAIAITLYTYRKHENYRKYASSIIQRLPFISNLMNKIYTARFCQSMALLIGAKTPLLNSIQLVKKMINYYPFERALDVVENDILHGVNLYESLSKFPIFEKKLISLVKVAEETNQLDTIFNQLNQQYSEEADYQISMIANFLEPVLIIFVGIMVAVILIAMYLPLFQISSSIM